MTVTFTLVDAMDWARHIAAHTGRRQKIRWQPVGDLPGRFWTVTEVGS